MNIKEENLSQLKNAYTVLRLTEDAKIIDAFIRNGVGQNVSILTSIIYLFIYFREKCKFSTLTLG